MQASKVTEYMVRYLKENGFLAEQISQRTGIPLRKLTEGSEQALYAEEFLELCAYLHIHPEQVADAVRDLREKQ